MVIVKLMGGLGNQLFQYAMARRLSAHLGVELKLDAGNYKSGGESRSKGLESFSRKYRLHEFNISAMEATDEEILALRDPYDARSSYHRSVRLMRRVLPRFALPRTHVGEKSFRFDPAILALSAPVYLQGFWQSEKYFIDHERIIREEFQLRDATVSARAREIVAALRSRGPSVVSLHVRRGDLAHAQEVLKRPEQTHGAPVTLEYIHRAIAEFPPESVFLVFSDTPQDVAWCRENIHAPNLAFAEAKSDIEDFATMSACDHHIISNSTFSWWAAWLNPHSGKRVFSPRVWSAPNPYKMPIDDLLPGGWRIL